MSQCNVASNVKKYTVISDLPTNILHKILELIPIQDAAKTSILSKQWRKLWFTQPHLVFDSLFFYYVSNIWTAPASIIHKILMQHIGPILGFHLISKTDILAQSDVDQCIIFVSNHGIQKLTLDMANDEKYALPYSIFTCATLTHLKLSWCFFELPEDSQFPNVVCLELEHSEVAGHRGSNNVLILPILGTLKLRYCTGVDRVNIFSPKIENLSIISSYTVTFQCFNVNPIFRRIKHICLDGSSLKNLGTFPVLDRLDVSLKLQSLKICDLKFSIKHISCAICLMRSSPGLRDLDIDEVVKDDEKVSRITELFSYLSKAQNQVSEALRMIRTVRLRKFKGSCVEMCLIEVILSNTPKLEKMIIEQMENKNARSSSEHLKALISYPRVSPKAKIKYLD